MWIISYEDKELNTLYVNQVFKRKTDAYIHIKTKIDRNKYSNVQLINAYTELIPDKLEIDQAIAFKNIREGQHYGEVAKITDHLVFIRNQQGVLVELTKARINKEYLKGNLIAS